MKVFIVGLPKSGRTTVAKALVETHGWKYIDAMSWVRSTFRSKQLDEHYQQYEDDYQQYLTKRMMVNPWFVSDHVFEMMKVNAADDAVFVIDGVASPKDFTALFDYRQDVIVFLNRTDNDYEYRDHENIGTSVIRDYCYWMSSAGLLPKKRWLEYNFKVPGDTSEDIKAMGAQNSVFIIKSFKKVLSHVSNKLKDLIDEFSK
jgi:adenylate kinase family enzyme